MKIIQAKKEVFYWQNLPTTQLLLRLFSVTFWASSINCKCGWFKIFGYGLTWKHETEGLMLNERMGYTKYLRLGKWIVKPCSYFNVFYCVLVAWCGQLPQLNNRSTEVVIYFFERWH